MEAGIEELEAGSERLERRGEHLELEYMSAAGSTSPGIDRPGSTPTLMKKDEVISGGGRSCYNNDKKSGSHRHAKG